MTQPRLLERARVALGTEPVSRWAWLLALLLVSPALTLGYVLDDLQQQAMVQGRYDSAARGPGELYCFSPGPGRGIDPALLSWWDDASSSLCFLRPISSWTLWIDHTLLWQRPALPHLHSVLWFMGLWFAWSAILRRYLPADVANLALLLTAASSAMAMTTAWIAARHGLVGGCFGVWGLYHVLASRDRAERGGLSGRELLGYALILLGLFSSEMVLGIFGLLVAREWFTRRRGAIARIAAYGACGLAFVASHARLGFGAPKFPLYLNPSGDPLTFLRAVPERLLALSGDLVLGVPSDAWVYPELVPLLALLGAASALLFVFANLRLFRELPEDLLQPLRWLGAGGLLCLAPCLSGMQGGRALTIAAFPLYALLATYLLRTARTGRLASLAFAGLFLGLVIGNPAAHAGWYGVLVGLDHAGEKSFDAEQAGCAPNSDVYLVDASESAASAWYARYWLKDMLRAKNFRQLTMSPLGFDSIALQRTGASSLTMRSQGAPLVGEMAIPPGTHDFFHPGLTRSYDDYRVNVKRVSERGPIEVDVDFSRPLDDPQLCIFVQDDVRLYALERMPIGGVSVLQPVSPLDSLAALFERNSAREARR